ncbi:MAG: DUF1549 and DUF1553 domain-containing protein [Pirellulales bacterium]
MRAAITALSIALALPCMLCTRLHADDPAGLAVFPTEVRLTSPFEKVQLVVRTKNAQGEVDDTCEDLSDQVVYQAAGDLIEVSPSGLITPKQNGTGSIEARVGDRSQSIPITISGVDAEPAVDFIKDVRPIFAKAGCAAAACHAAQHGKGGFKLSVFGYDPNADYDQIVSASRGRRICPSSPDSSLIVVKALNRIPHVGGVRFPSDSTEHQMLRRWIQAGAPKPTQPEAVVERLEVTPAQRVGRVGYSQQLRVTAHYQDGSSRDVTPLTLFDTLDTGIVNVIRSGKATTCGQGQTSVMVRYEGRTAIATFIVPYSTEPHPSTWQNNNYVDELAAVKFRDLGLEPSPLCDDATFVRRAFLDAVGSLPDPQTVTTFLESTDAKKREQLVDRLLGLTGDPALDIYNDRYSALWTLRWSDLIRNNSDSLGEQGMWAMHNWIRQSFRENKPFDRFVYELVTAKGSIYSNGPANYFRVHPDSSTLTEATSQLFMGLRLECAKCHQHPFESISQSDYYSMAAFFSRVASKNSEEFGLFGRETVVMVRPSGEVNHPKTGKKMAPTPLRGEPMENELDRRIPLAEWLTAPSNPYFARSVVNRYVGFLLGAGLVEPVDDMRSTNPPSNAALIDALTEDFVKHQFNLKHLIRTIMTSRLYQLSSQPTKQNATDSRYYSRFNVKRLTAEPLLDAIDHATGVPTKFPNLPLGTLAIELPDAEYPDYFLTTFAKPKRVSVCSCERSPDANLAQALHTLNGETLMNKIASKQGRVSKLIEAGKPHEEIVRELYLAAMCRLPSTAELEASQEILKQSATPQDAYQDLLWALINSKQFLFVH